MDAEKAREILAGRILMEDAELVLDRAERPNLVTRLVIDLTTARTESDPLEIGFPFKSIFVAAATDSSVSVNFKPGTKETIQGYMPLQRNANWTRDRRVERGFLHWEAQSGKSITLLIFPGSIFSSGSMISIMSGGVSISHGDSFSRQVVSLTGGAAGVLLAQDADRKHGYVEAPIDADLYIGESTVTNAGATKGLRVPAGERFEWKNTAALYGYLAANGDVVTMSQE